MAARPKQTPGDDGPEGPRAGRPRDMDVDARIRASAGELMAEGGYEAVTIAGVARRAGLPRSTVYRRHPSQFSLRYSTLVLPAGGLSPLRDTGDIATDMRTHIGANATAFIDPAAKALVRSITTDVLGDAEGRRLVADQEFLPRLAEVSGMIERARARGDLPARCDPAIAATAITGTLMYHALILDQPVDDAFLDRLTALLFSD